MSLAVDSRREGRWLADPGFGVYVHIPFCAKRCHYCDFNTYEGLDDLHRAYVDALVTEIARAPAPVRPATSVFFGGGTPTLLPPADLGRILAAIGERFGMAPDAEVTVEANPDTLDEEVFAGLLAVGFNRFSVGVQSLRDHVLAGLGRTHGRTGALEALAAARAAGVTDINADLIYGSPWETAEDWAATLDAIVATGPDHISAYALTVEEATPLATLVTTGRVPDVDPDVQADRHARATGVLAGAGYARYEVSNWARPHAASAHNTLYWSAGDHAAFGAGAHGHSAGHRYWRMRLPRDYITAVQTGASTVAGAEDLDPDARAGEALMLGLRLASGVPLDDFAERFGAAPLDQRAPAIDECLRLGLLERDRDTIRVPETATMIASETFLRLL